LVLGTTRIITMKKTIIIIILLFTFYNLYSQGIRRSFEEFQRITDLHIGETWDSVTYLSGEQHVKCIATRNDGIAILGTSGTGKIYRTMNYGSNWVDCGKLGVHVVVGAVTYADTGIWLAGTGINTNEIYRSVDDGFHWDSIQTLGTGTAICKIKRLSNGRILVGRTSGAPTTLYKSDNNGASFTELSQTFTFASAIYEIIDLGAGIVLCYTNAGHVWRSTNYGDTWTRILLGFPNTGYVTSGMYMGNGKIIVGTTSPGRVYKSLDFGYTYTLNYTPSDFTAVLCADYVKKVALVGGYTNAVIIRSIDTAANWTDLGRQRGQVYLNTIAHFPNGVCLAGTGSTAKILRSIPANVNLSGISTVIHETAQETTFIPIMGDKSTGFDQTRSNHINNIVAGYGQSTILAVGDFEEEWPDVSEDATCIGLESYKNTNLYCSGGNHDYYRKKWDDWFVNNKLSSYAKVSVGEIDFFVLDNYMSLNNDSICAAPQWTLAQFKAGKQGHWLDSVLVASTAKWKVILCHSMYYTFMAWDWKSYKVNLALFGDRHVYSHQSHVYADGEIHVVCCGGTGAGLLPILQYPVDGFTFVKQISGQTNQLCSWGMIIKVWPGTNYLHVKMYGVNASSVTELDHFEIGDFSN
jgi:photosystem II stability/assembly factor-like uncharacterized protein